MKNKRINKNRILKAVLISNVVFLLLGILVGVLISSDDVDKNSRNNQGNILDNTDMNGKSSGSANIVAVTDTGFGVIGKVNVDIVDGEGRVLVNTNPFIEPDTQFSAITAVNVAKNVTNTNLEDKNVIIDFKVPKIDIEHKGVVGGPSAGVAMTLAVISAINGRNMKDVVATGAILPDGSIGQIGGVIEKADAVSDNNYTLFLIPQGQGKYVYYERQIRNKEVKGIKVKSVVLVPKAIDLIDYFKQEKNLTIREVEDINDVLSYAF